MAHGLAKQIVLVYCITYMASPVFRQLVKKILAPVNGLTAVLNPIRHQAIEWSCIFIHRAPSSLKEKCPHLAHPHNSKVFRVRRPYLKEETVKGILEVFYLVLVFGHLAKYAAHCGTNTLRSLWK
ncbi:hypothetical protein KIL84_020520 [Mauremys mutica]|uniref:Uncharacterized protein n=1 Tax=Mauremys mutica TaxID=74926 RepID=A0A9D4BBA1_9SAUR|nr:hypothetical protein KIL84_020520 [Mauremys mutica]